MYNEMSTSNSKSSIVDAIKKVLKALRRKTVGKKNYKRKTRKM
jgi:hypothetical protein